MPWITIKNNGTKYETNASISILNTLLRNDVSIQHRCGGRMQCGTCKIKIVSGAENITKIKEQEMVRLKAVNAKPDERLACQCHIFKDVTIELPE